MEDFSYKQIPKNPNEAVTWPITLSWAWLFIFAIPAIIGWVPWWFPFLILLLRIAFRILIWMFFITIGAIAFFAVIIFFLFAKMFQK